MNYNTLSSIHGEGLSICNSYTHASNHDDIAARDSPYTYTPATYTIPAVITGKRIRTASTHIYSWDPYNIATPDPPIYISGNQLKYLTSQIDKIHNNTPSPFGHISIWIRIHIDIWPNGEGVLLCILSIWLVRYFNWLPDIYMGGSGVAILYGSQL